MKLKKRLLFIYLLFALISTAQEPLYDYLFFNNSRMEGNYFFSKTSSVKPSAISEKEGKLPVSQEMFHTPGNALLLEFENGKKGNWAASITKPEYRGQDHFRTSAYLSFYLYRAAGENGDGIFAIQLQNKDKKLSAKFMVNSLVKGGWEQIVVPLSFFKKFYKGKPEDMETVIFSQLQQDGSKHTCYIDDIEFITELSGAVPNQTPVIESATGFARHIDLSWKPTNDTSIRYVKIYRSADGNSFQPIAIQQPSIGRFTDFTGQSSQKYHYKISLLDRRYRETSFSEMISANTREMNDEELMTMVQEACFRYYWEGAEKASGLALENISGRQNMIATGASGFGMMALIAGTERNFITREQSVARFEQIVNFLEKAETFHGVFSHFVDGPTGKVVPFFGKRDNGGDLVETSFLLQGLLTARAYFSADNPREKMIREKITSIWERTEWDWYRRYPDSKFLYWHWSPDKAWVINHRLIGWNETMVTYLLAIASPTHGVPASMYYSGWANQDSTGKQYRTNWGGTTDGSAYSNGKTYYGIKLDVGVSNGGPLFFTHYSYLGYDPHLINDKYTNYFLNNQAIARINHKYCIDNPGKYKGYSDSCWGLTASDGPFNYAADEPVLRQDKGKIGPTGAISSFPYTPEESMKALRHYYNQYGKFLWGEYGFRDAFNLTQNWCSEIYMGLNQAPMVVMIENYRTGLLWKLLMSDKDVQEGLKRLESETNKLQ